MHCFYFCTKLLVRFHASFRSHGDAPIKYDAMKLLVARALALEGAKPTGHTQTAVKKLIVSCADVAILILNLDWYHGAFTFELKTRSL